MNLTANIGLLASVGMFTDVSCVCVCVCVQVSDDGKTMELGWRLHGAMWVSLLLQSPAETNYMPCCHGYYSAIFNFGRSNIY